MIYRGDEYDSSVEYFGPQDHWLSKIIPKFPPSLEDCPEEVQEMVRRGFNRAAWKHDVDYEQKKKFGLWGWIVNFFKRRSADMRFWYNMEGAILAIEGLVSDDEVEAALDYAEYAYRSVRVGGVAFYGS